MTNRLIARQWRACDTSHRVRRIVCSGSRVEIYEKFDVYSHRGIGPVAAFLHRLTEKHDVSDTEFLVDAGGYLTAFFRHDLSGQINYEERKHIEKWFQTVSMQIDRFHSFWRGSQSSARRWLRRFRHYYNHDRPNQALNNQTPVEVVLN